MTIIASRVLLGFILAIALVVSASGQMVEVHGTVVDKNGAVVADASIFFEDTESERIVAETRTDFEGEFSIKIAPKTYRFTIRSVGFETFVNNQIVVTETRVTHFKFELKAKLGLTTDCNLGSLNVLVESKSDTQNLLISPRPNEAMPPRFVPSKGKKDRRYK